jgi:fatty acid desaturase
MRLLHGDLTGKPLKSACSVNHMRALSPRSIARRIMKGQFKRLTQLETGKEKYMKRSSLARKLFLFVAIGYFLLGVLFVLAGVRDSNTFLYVVAAGVFLIGIGHVYFATRMKKAR